MNILSFLSRLGGENKVPKTLYVQRRLPEVLIAYKIWPLVPIIIVPSELIAGEL
jgi:hypothetical protein